MSDEIYRNRYVKVLRIPGKRVSYEVRRIDDGMIVHSFNTKEFALDYAKHVELWQPMLETEK